MKAAASAKPRDESLLLRNVAGSPKDLVRQLCTDVVAATPYCATPIDRDVRRSKLWRSETIAPNVTWEKERRGSWPSFLRLHPYSDCVRRAATTCRNIERISKDTRCDRRAQRCWRRPDANRAALYSACQDCPERVDAARHGTFIPYSDGCGESLPACIDRRTAGLCLDRCRKEMIVT